MGVSSLRYLFGWPGSRRSLAISPKVSHPRTDRRPLIFIQDADSGEVLDGGRKVLFQEEAFPAPVLLPKKPPFKRVAEARVGVADKTDKKERKEVKKEKETGQKRAAPKPGKDEEVVAASSVAAGTRPSSWTRPTGGQALASPRTLWCLAVVITLVVFVFHLHNFLSDGVTSSKHGIAWDDADGRFARSEAPVVYYAAEALLLLSLAAAGAGLYLRSRTLLMAAAAAVLALDIVLVLLHILQAERDLEKRPDPGHDPGRAAEHHEEGNEDDDDGGGGGGGGGQVESKSPSNTINLGLWRVVHDILFYVIWDFLSCVALATLLFLYSMHLVD